MNPILFIVFLPLLAAIVAGLAGRMLGNTAAKVITITVALQAGTGLVAMAAVLITDFDRSVIGSMLAFWFVDRSLRRARP